MKEIDEKTQQALLLFNRRAENAEKESQAANEIKKAEKIKDEAVAALQKVKDSGSDPEVIAEAESAWRNALDTWQKLRDGEEIEETPEETPEETNGPKELELENKKFTKISIFMNVFDCHVNRTPCAGKISQILYKPGKFINASLDKSSEENERNYYKIQNSFGEDIIVVQIAGLIARRIVNESHESQELKQGERIGMIRFGSRADVYFENYKPLVKVNQKTIAGETLLAKK